MNTLETQRLLLRAPLLNDLEDLKMLYADPQVGFALNPGKCSEPVSGRQRLMEQISVFQREGFGLFSVVMTDLGQVVGQCGLRRQTIEGKDRLVVCGAINASLRRQGLATEALTLVCENAKEQWPEASLIGVVDERNIGATTLAAHLGFTKAGPTKIAGRSLTIFSLT